MTEFKSHFNPETENMELVVTGTLPACAPVEVWKIFWRDSFGVDCVTWTDANGKYLDGVKRPGVDA